MEGVRGDEPGDDAEAERRKADSRPGRGQEDKPRAEGDEKQWVFHQEDRRRRVPATEAIESMAMAMTGMVQRDRREMSAPRAISSSAFASPLGTTLAGADVAKVATGRQGGER